MKINILDSSVYNLISAGEVIENPASVVKELVENSIDAGATMITVKIENGGISFIEVTDNGLGIPKTELHKTILPHATAKLENIDDLNSISTLGFRGEALASISSVSDFEIVTKFSSDQYGCKLVIISGKVRIEDCASLPGTTVRVLNLFHNLPARFKFLKKPQYEAANISTLITQLVLANPYVGFKFYADKRLVYSSSGAGLTDSISAIYGEENFSNMLETIPVEYDKLRISGYIGTPRFTKFNRSFQSIIVNGRLISDSRISASVQNAYAERLMKKNYPVFVLNIVLPFEDVDSNVHPNKREVRFQDPNKVYSAVYHTIKLTLDSYDDKQTSIFPSKMRSEGSSYDENLDQSMTNTHNNKSQSAIIKGNTQKFTNSSVFNNPNLGLFRDLENIKTNKYTHVNGENNLNINNQNIGDTKSINMDNNSKNYFIDSDNLPNDCSRIIVQSDLTSVLADVHSGQPNMDYDIAFETPHTGQPQVEITDTFYHSGQDLVEVIDDTPSYTIVGQLFNTYLIIESDSKMYMIDQHATHERMLYDQLVKQIDSHTPITQPLILPYIYEGTPIDIERISEQIPHLLSIGFDISEFGNNKIKIDGVPSPLNTISLDTFISEILTQFKGKQLTTSELSKDLLAGSACKAAIKGATPLSSNQLQLLVSKFISKNIPLNCPHGRPTYIVMDKNEIEKLFRRRV
ncbi:MAG: DNA mismatch repair endonuclease MutL [Christensenellaceae bacterium]|jgi:DNA mismatch repair protein MutL|nr:DNA mismatch repair endonuclease MutL [Christensenellaceae bacterium]